ncbi:hypothetical protein AB3N60_13945 [Leptospira sp. WS39.C2]
MKSIRFTKLGLFILLLIGNSDAVSNYGKLLFLKDYNRSKTINECSFEYSIEETTILESEDKPMIDTKNISNSMLLFIYTVLVLGFVLVPFPKNRKFQKCFLRTDSEIPEKCIDTYSDGSRLETFNFFEGEVLEKFIYFDPSNKKIKEIENFGEKGIIIK